MIRRFGLLAVALVLVVVVGTGLGWFVITDSISETYDSEALGGECGPMKPAEFIDSFTHYTPVPDDPELAPARQAFLDTVGAKQWRFEVSSTGDGDPIAMTIVRDGDAIEFRRDNGTRGHVTPDRTLLGTDDSGFWLSTCDDPSITLFPPGRTSCVDHHSDGADIVYTYRSDRPRCRLRDGDQRRSTTRSWCATEGSAAGTSTSRPRAAGPTTRGRWPRRRTSTIRGRGRSCPAGS